MIFVIIFVHSKIVIFLFESLRNLLQGVRIITIKFFSEMILFCCSWNRTGYRINFKSRSSVLTDPKVGMLCSPGASSNLAIVEPPCFPIFKFKEITTAAYSTLR